MKQYLLMLPMMCLTATASMAQTSYDTALEATVGENTYNVEGEDMQTIIWKYTAEKNSVIGVGPLPNTYTYPSVCGVQGKDTVNMKSANLKYGINGYPMEAGKTYFFLVQGRGTTGFLIDSVNDLPDVGGGLQQDAPVNIVPGTMTFVGDAYNTSYASYKAYARYTATEDAQLVLTTGSYLAESLTVNGNRVESEYSNNMYVTKLGVENGKTYDFVFNITQPVLFKSELAHPQPGSLDMPFAMVEGDNTVPADYGQYYYTYTPTKAGFFTITSDKELPGGVVKVYNNKYSISYDGVLAKSEQGSYNVRVEIENPGTRLYVLVDKIDGTSDPETFRMAMEDYKEGEKENNPIMIESLPAQLTMPDASGTIYYGVDVPANTNQMLVVKADRTVAEGTTVSVYPEGNQWNGATGTSGAEYNVNTSGATQRFIIRWSAVEKTPLSFSVKMRDIEKGELITDPLEAVLGKNDLAAEGTRYYKYTATRDGKLSVEPTSPAITVEFPRGTDSWSGTYDAVVNGINYSVEATKGTEYLIKLQNCKAGDAFTLAETDFAAGEIRKLPIDMESNEYTFASNQSNVWLRYTAKRDCLVTVDFDGDFNTANTVEYGKDGKDQYGYDRYLSPMITSTLVGETSTNIYRGTIVLLENEALLVHLKLVGNAEGKKVTFAEGDVPAGHAANNPCVLKPGESVDVKRGSEFWVLANLTEGDNLFKTNTYCRVYTYSNEEDALNLTNEDYPNFDYKYEDNQGSYWLTKTVDADQPIYFRFMPDNDFTFTYVKGGKEETGIVSAEANTDSNVEVFTIGGAKVADSTDALKQGIYVIRQNGKTFKKVVK